MGRDEEAGRRKGANILSLGVKSKKVVADAMLRLCWNGKVGVLLPRSCCLSLPILRNDRALEMPVLPGCPCSLMAVWKREREACMNEIKCKLLEPAVKDDLRFQDVNTSDIRLRLSSTEVPAGRAIGRGTRCSQQFWLKAADIVVRMLVIKSSHYLVPDMIDSASSVYGKSLGEKMI